MKNTLRVLVAVLPDLSEPGGADILEDLRRLGDEFELGRCIVVEADMDALALIDKARELGADELVLFGPRSLRGRRSGVHLRHVEPRRVGATGPETLSLVRELWPNLTGSLRLEDYVAALQLLLGREFTVVECEPGGVGCRGVLEKWLREFCENGAGGSGQSADG